MLIKAAFFEQIETRDRHGVYQEGQALTTIHLCTNSATDYVLIETVRLKKVFFFKVISNHFVCVWYTLFLPHPVSEEVEISYNCFLHLSYQ